MPLHINEVAVNEIATLTGVDPAKLKAELFVDAADAPTESKVKDLFLSTVIMPKKDHETLIDNHGKNKFDEGKLRSLTDITKVALGEKAFEVTKDMKREDVWAKIHTEAKSIWDVDNKKEPDVKLKEVIEEKRKLQETVQEKEAALAKLTGELEETKTSGSKEKEVIAAVSAIQFESAGEILSKQQQVVIKNIISSYTRKVEDGVSVWYDSNGIKQVDSLQNPKTIGAIAKEEAVIFPTIKADSGRSDESSKHNNSSGNLDAELKAATTPEALTKLIEARGLSPMSTEGRAIISQWNTIHRK